MCLAPRSVCVFAAFSCLLVAPLPAQPLEPLPADPTRREQLRGEWPKKHEELWQKINTAVANGSLEKVLEVADKLLELEVDLLGPKHELVADSTVRAADLYWAGYKFEKAAKFYVNAADRVAALYGEEYQRVATFRAYARQSTACAKLTGESQARFLAADRLYSEAQTLRARLDDSAAAEKYSAARAGYAEVLGEDSIHVLYALLGEGACRLASKSGLAAGEEVLDRARKVSAAVFGEQHPTSAAIHFDLGNLASDRGDPKRAEMHFMKAVEIRRRAASQSGPDWENTNQLRLAIARVAVFYRSRGEYVAAEKYCTEAADRHAKYFRDNNHWLVIDARASARHDAACARLSAEQLARLAAADKMCAEAQSLAGSPDGWKRAVEKYTAARTVYTDLFGETCIPVQNTLYGEGSVLTDSGADPVKLAQVLERSLVVSEAVFGSVHPTGATARNGLGILATSLGDYKQAEAHFKKAIEIRQAMLQWRLVPTAVSMTNLGILYTRQGDYARALPLLNDAYQILRENKSGLYDRKAVGLYSEQTAWAAQNIGRFRTQMGDYNAADEMYQLAASIRGAVAEKHPALIGLLADRGDLALALGDTTAAVRHYTKALELAEAVYGNDGVTTANVLNNLGRVYDHAGQAERSQQAFTRSLDITRAKLGAKHPDTLATVVNLGSLHLSAGRLGQAEPLLTEGLTVTKEVLGERHPNFAAALFNLAVLHLRKGEFEQAERAGDAARTAREQIYGKDHWATAYDLQFRGTREAATGHPREALAAFRGAMELEDKHLRAVFGFASETAMRGTAEAARGTLSKVLSLAAGPLADDPTAVEFALQAVLRRKATVLDTLCRQRELYNLLQNNSEVAQSAALVRQSYEKYQQALHHPPATGRADEHARRVSDFRREYEEWDGRLHRVVERLRPTPDPAPTDGTIAGLRARLPVAAALVEVVRTERYDFERVATAEFRPTPRYYAVVLTADAKTPPRLIDLGAAAPLDDRIREYRTSLARTTRDLRVASEKQAEAGLNELAGELTATVFAPLAKHLRGVNKLYLAPDGEFHTLPFESLTDADGRYLIESYQFNYLSSGRDLLRTAGKPASGVRVFAGPDFDWHPQLANTPPAAGPEPSPAGHTSVPGLVRGVPRSSVRGLTWRPLPGAEREAADVKELLGDGAFGDVQVFTGNQARKSVFLEQTPPRVLHLATHGFYLPEQSATDDGWRVTTVRHEQPTGELGLPSLRRSGVLLAGANRTAVGRPLPAAEDGWLTAEEIALMSLRGTELVVLSACETGLGDVRSGEGVYGLRRAFLSAGARSLIVSLFKVPDGETRELMRGFYQRLNSGKGRLTALHEAKRDAIAKRRAAGGAAHPFYWASFILVGNAD